MAVTCYFDNSARPTPLQAKQRAYAEIPPCMLRTRASIEGAIRIGADEKRDVAPLEDLH